MREMVDIKQNIEAFCSGTAVCEQHVDAVIPSQDGVPVSEGVLAFVPCDTICTEGWVGECASEKWETSRMQCAHIHLLDVP